MERKAVIVSHGLHPPWNMGEVVLARNLASVLTKLYSDTHIFSTIDGRRGLSNASDFKPHFDIRYHRSEKSLKITVLEELDPHVDIHFINASFLKFFNIIKKSGRIYLYQFAYNIFNNPKLIARSLGALPLIYLSNVRIFTTSLNSYLRFQKFFVQGYHYIPAPIFMLNEELITTSRSCDELRLLYLGHGSHLRFPYDKVLKAVKRLKKKGSSIKLNIWISELGYVNYMEFVKTLRSIIEKLKLKDFVKLHLKNLSEAEKWRVIHENDVVLLPSLVNAAIDPPLVILEAMFMGKCVIATPIQSIPHLLGNDRGITINRRNLEDDLYKAIKMLEENPTLLKEYGANARRWSIETHSMGAVYNRMKGILNGP